MQSSLEQERRRCMLRELRILRRSACNDLNHWYYSYRCEDEEVFYGGANRIKEYYCCDDLDCEEVASCYKDVNRDFYYFGSIAQCSHCLTYLQFHTEICQCCLFTRNVAKP
jgi:hypothetical protein